MGARNYKIVITRGEDGFFVVECPAIPGCVSQGKTKQEALANIKEAIELALECYEEDKQPLPLDTSEIGEVAVNV